MKPLGHLEEFRGDVTTLNWIGPRPPQAIERNLGFAARRLAAGYWVVLLAHPLAPGDFVFSGNTLRSGGREGLPASSLAADALRPRIHDLLLAERGQQGYEHLQQQVLRTIAIKGPERIAKVIPV